MPHCANSAVKVLRFDFCKFSLHIIVVIESSNNSCAQPQDDFQTVESLLDRLLQFWTARSVIPKFKPRRIPAIRCSELKIAHSNAEPGLRSLLFFLWQACQQSIRPALNFRLKQILGLMQNLRSMSTMYIITLVPTDNTESVSRINHGTRI